MDKDVFTSNCLLLLHFNTDTDNRLWSGDSSGELARPKGLTVMPDGRLVIAESSKCGYVVFDGSLEFVEEIGLWANNSPYGKRLYPTASWWFAGMMKAR